MVDIGELLDGIAVKQRFMPDDEFNFAFDQATKFNLSVHLKESFSKSELRTLSFRLNIDFDDLSGETKANKAEELISFCQRHHRVRALLDTVRKLRPHLKI